MSIAVDVTDTIEVRAAGIRALNGALGVDGARVFMRQCFGGRGDLTREKYDRPDLTPAEFTAMADMLKAEAEAAGMWE